MSSILYEFQMEYANSTDGLSKRTISVCVCGGDLMSFEMQFTTIYTESSNIWLLLYYKYIFGYVKNGRHPINKHKHYCIILNAFDQSVLRICLLFPQFFIHLHWCQCRFTHFLFKLFVWVFRKKPFIRSIPIVARKIR